MKTKSLALTLAIFLALMPAIACASNFYLFPDSNQRRLTNDEVCAWQYDALGYAMNELFARYGRPFESGGKYDAYFHSQDWYREDPNYPRLGPNLDDGAVLSAIEWDNYALIKQVREEMRAAGTTNSMGKPLPVSVAAAAQSENTASGMNADVTQGPFLAALSTGEVVDLYGNAFNADIMLKQPTIINIWATWCGPCVGEIPALITLSKEYAGKINFVGVQLDAVTNDMKTDASALASAKDLLGSKSSAYPSLIPTQDIMDLIGEMEVDAIPTTWVLDTQGNIVDTIVGSNDIDGWRAEIEQILAQYGK